MSKLPTILTILTPKVAAAMASLLLLAEAANEAGKPQVVVTVADIETICDALLGIAHSGEKKSSKSGKNKKRKSK